MKRTYINHIMGRLLLAAMLLAVSWTSAAEETAGTQGVVMTDGFAEGGAGWKVRNDDAILDANAASTGPRILHNQTGFTSDVLYLCSRGANGGHCVAWYGAADKKLTLQTGTYRLTFDAASFDSELPVLKVQVFPASAVSLTDTEEYLASVLALAEESKTLVANFRTSTNATSFDIEIPITDVGDYVLRFETSDSIGSTSTWDDACVIGNVKVSGEDGTIPEPYAVLSDNNTVLTFYYDGQKAARGGMSVGPFSQSSDRGWSQNTGDITTVVFDNSFANCTTLTSTAYWFDDCLNLSTITGISNLKTDNVTYMIRFFAGCSSLRSLDVTGFKTDNVTNTNSMFYNCSGLTNLNLSGFNTVNVTNMAGMFWGCSGLTNLELTGFRTDNATDMGAMFVNCSSLTSLDVSSFNTANATDINSLFHNCSSLTRLDLSGFKTENVEYMGYMFNGCSALKTIYVGSGWSTGSVTAGTDMFTGCTSLIGGAGTTFNAAHVDYAYAHIDGAPDNPGYFTELIRKTLTADDYFEWDGMGANSNKTSETPSRLCNYYIGQSAEVPYGDPNVSAYAYADLSAYDRLEITATAGTPRILLNRDAEDGYWNADESQSHQIESTQSGWSSKYFSHSGNVWTVDLKQMVADKGFAHLNAIKGDNWSAVTITKMELVKGLVENTSAEPYAVLSENNTVLTFYYDDQKAARGGMDVGPFYIPDQVTWKDYQEVITTVVFNDSFANNTTLTSILAWFRNFKNLTNVVGINNLKTDNVTNMDFAFMGCSSLTSLDVTGFKTDNVEMMNNMFDGCSALTSIDLSHFNTEKVTNMSSMFYGCSSLTSLDVTGFNTSNVTHMGSMFRDCSGLTSLDLSQFDTKNVTSMGAMFSGCSGLTSLDLSHFNTESLTFIGYMFDGCSGLTSLNMSGFNTTNVTNMESVFQNCSNLTSIDLSGFNTANVTSMYAMFFGCEKLSTLDVSSFNTTNVTDMAFMFGDCMNLTHINWGSNFNTEKVTSMRAMFQRCWNMPSIDVSGFNTANVKNMQIMFTRCYGLTNLDLSNFNTEQVEDMHGFYGNSSLASIQAGNAVIPDSVYAQIGNPNLLLYVNEASQAPQSVTNVVVLDEAEYIALTDSVAGNINFYCPRQFRARSISFTHNYKQNTEVGVSRGWETIALPFTVQTITHEKNGTLVPFGAEGGKPFWLKELTDKGLVSAQRIEANRPYLISMPNSVVYPSEYNQGGNVTFSATDVVVPITEQRGTSGNNRMLIPTTTSVAKSPDIYAINRNASYENNPEGSIFVADYREVRPFEAYVKHPAGGARYFTLSDFTEGDVTGIETIELPQWNGDNWWTLDGRKLNGRPSQKGIYIRNGKKVVVNATF